MVAFKNERKLTDGSLVFDVFNEAGDVVAELNCRKLTDGSLVFDVVFHEAGDVAAELNCINEFAADVLLAAVVRYTVNVTE